MYVCFSSDWALVVQVPLPDNVRPSDINAVSVRLIKPEGLQGTNNLLAVTHLQNNKTAPKVDFTICTSPMFFNYSDVGEFLQMVEVGQMLGVNKFVIYDLSIGKELLPYVQYYKKKGIVDVLPWNIPRYNDANPKAIHQFIHYFGQVISINDCVYRYMYKTSYVAVLDLDEIIVPLKSSTWSGMLSRLNQTSHTYDFKCVFFKKEWPDDEMYSNQTGADVDFIKKLNLRVLLKTKREKKIWDHKTRSKEMVRPEVVKFYHIHFVSHYQVKSYEHDVVDVPEEEAILFHYRYWNSKDTNWIVDRRMHTVASEIIHRISEVVTKVNTTV